MYCLKCRRVTETENITTAMSKNGRIMRRGQCITCGKTKTQSIHQKRCHRTLAPKFLIGDNVRITKKKNCFI